MFGWLKQHPRAIKRFKEKERISILNTERDWLKHGGQPAKQICCSDAAFMIARAASKLGNVFDVAGEMPQTIRGVG